MDRSLLGDRRVSGSPALSGTFTGRTAESGFCVVTGPLGSGGLLRSMASGPILSVVAWRKRLLAMALRLLGRVVRHKRYGK
jgi:hypothetical protein